MNDNNLTETIGNYEQQGLSKYDIVKKLQEIGIEDSVIINALNSFPFQKKWNGSIAGCWFLGFALLFFISTNISQWMGFVLNNHGLQFWIESVFVPTLTVSYLLVGIYVLIDKSNIHKTVIKTLQVFLIGGIVCSIVTFSFFTLIVCVLAFVWFILWDMPVKPAEGDAAYLVNAVNTSVDARTALNNLGLKKWDGNAASLWMILGFFMFIGVHISRTAGEYDALSGIMNIVFYGMIFVIALSLISLSVLLYKKTDRYRYLMFLIVFLCLIYLALLYFTIGINPAMIPPVVTITVLGKLIEDKKLYRFTTPVNS